MARASSFKSFSLKCLLYVGVSIIWLISVLPAPAASKEGVSEFPHVTRKLVVGTKETPPFAMKDADGHWTGISIDLWRQIAKELNFSYEWRELDLNGLLAGLEDGSLDVAVGNLTITPDRLDKIDFTYPFYTTGLGIAVTMKETNLMVSILKHLISWTMLKILLITGGLLLIVGLAVWFFERKRNPDHFGGTKTEGIVSGVWFSASTMTTVGYGDKHPKTLGGRLVALFWMFLSVILVAFFTAMITSMLTVKQLSPGVRGLEDMKREWVGTLPYTTSEAFLVSNYVSYKTYATVPEGLAALVRGEIKAFVYDMPALRYWIKEQFVGKLEVLPHTYSQENYGLALQNNSPWRKAINRVLLEKIRDEKWQETLSNYMGG